MDNLIIENTFQKENFPFYQYSEFQNVKLINANIFKATFKISQKTVAFKNIYLNDNDKFTLDNLINEIKRYRKLGIHDSILKFYGITKQENTNNYMIILEYVNEGSLRQYLKTNFQKLDWNAKLNLAKQIADVLMFLHSNNIIHGKFNSENILIHNGIIKLNVFGLTKIISDSLRFFTNNTGPVQYMDSQHLELFNTIGKNKSSDIFGLGIILWEISSGNPPFEMESSSNVDLLNNIVKGIREMAIPGTPHKYKEIYTDCWKHHGNSRPNISHVVENLSEIIISDSSVEFGTPQSQPNNVTDLKSDNLNIQKEEPGIKPDLFNDITTDFINDLFEIFIDIYKKQFIETVPFMIKNYIRELKKNCWKHHGNSRPNISHVVENLSEIIISDSSVEFGTPQSQPNNVTDLKSDNLNIQKEEPGIKPDLFNDITTDFINDLFEIFIDIYKKQFIETVPFMIKNYIRELKKSPVKILFEMIRHPSYYLYSSLIGFFYQCGIGTVVDYRMAFKFFNLAANEIIDTSSSDSSSLRKLYNINREIGIISLADMYFDGIGVEKDTKKAFQIYNKLAFKGSLMSLNTVAYCYDDGLGVEKNEEKAFELYLKSAEKGNIPAQSNVSLCYEYGTGITKDEVKGFQWNLKSALAGNINAMFNVGCSYDNGIGVCVDEKEAFKWYLEAAEKGLSIAQHNLGRYYKDGEGIDEDQVKAFEWFKKAAENDYSNCQYKLGECFYDGYGTEKDIVKAVYWLNRAKENGNTDAEQLLEEIINSII
ncbi:hypothetical protein Glove_140g71 [Diversispora epigaea]|uniref:Protein kinase domain-containing protein n=1 Tax=Diversispora epigaea TaxID=1348612 RepID=A0A397IV13_9GLOM|nr:hypothetical protein Glove_140g71 [Diversispora epigaea]